MSMPPDYNGPAIWGLTGPTQPDDPKGEREVRATDAWANLTHSVNGKLPRAIKRAERARRRIARMR